MITLISNDGVRYDVDTNIIVASAMHPMMSNTLKNLLDTYECNDFTFSPKRDDVVSHITCNIKSDILKYVIDYCRKYCETNIYIDYNDTFTMNDINAHIEYHKYNPYTEEHVCNYKSTNICRTWKLVVSKYIKHLSDIVTLSGGLCPLRKSNGFECAINAPETVALDTMSSRLYYHLNEYHSVQYCCPNDYELYLKNTHDIISDVGESMLSAYLSELNDGKQLSDTFIGQLYFAAEFLDITILKNDIVILLGSHIEKIIETDFKNNAIKHIEKILGANQNKISNPSNNNILELLKCKIID